MSIAGCLHNPVYFYYLKSEFAGIRTGFFLLNNAKLFLS
jgi:hypothetical protein